MISAAMAPPPATAASWKHLPPAVTEDLGYANEFSLPWVSGGVARPESVWIKKKAHIFCKKRSAFFLLQTAC
jgi:hypothetical protein